LLLLDFSQPKPTRVVPNYHEVMIEAEGSGILNWFLRGAQDLVGHIQSGKSFPISDRQRSAIDNLLGESDSVRCFITDHVRGSAMSCDCITTDELYHAYLQMCNSREWSPEPEKRFQRRAADLMLEIHQAVPTKHLRKEGREGEDLRGYMKVTLTTVDSY
jgi:phage/plasmid-associated DNA primase